MKGLRILLLITFTCFSLNLFAEDEKTYNCYGLIYSNLTKTRLVGAKISAINANDSVVAVVESQSSNNGSFLTATYTFNLPEGTYTIRYEMKGYQTKEVPFTVRPTKAFTTYIRTVYLDPAPRKKDVELGEVTVKATRIKMVQKGDTVVFNADAFDLPQGSLLDALIEELPGVQLRENGEIFVNGRKVDELLLNGKNFFRGNRNVLLENLPAFMVKDIKVYEKDDPYRPKLDEKPYVMDVGLKKEYRTGWIANAELAGGNDERYLGKLFGLGFGGHTSWSAFANQNNINDHARPGRDASFATTNIASGLTTTRKAGFEWQKQDMNNVWTFVTTNEVTDTRTDRDVHTNSVIFLPTRNTYSASRALSSSRYTLWKTGNRLDFRLGSKDLPRKPLNGTLNADLSYSTTSNGGNNWSLTMDTPFDSLSAGRSLAELAQTSALSDIYSHILNRNNSSSLSEGHALNANVGVNGFYSNDRTGNMFFFDSKMDYQDQRTTSYQKYLIDYPRDGKTADFRHQNSVTPLNSLSIKNNLKYIVMVGDIAITPSLEYNHLYSSSDRTLFNLHDVIGYGADARRQLTELPSTRDSIQMALDARNSYYSRRYDDEIVPGINMGGFDFEAKHHQLRFDFTLALPYTHNKMRYRREGLGIDTVLTRNTLFFSPKIHIRYHDNKRHNQFDLDYSVETTAPSLLYSINIYDDANPLFISLGNSGLKNTRQHSIRLFHSKFYAVGNAASGERVWQSLSNTIEYRVITNTVANGVSYDPLTGVRTSKPYNVNGNWMLLGKTDYAKILGKKGQMVLNAHTNYDYYHSVDLTGENSIETLERSVVNTLNLGEEATLKYKVGKNSYGFKTRVSYSNVTSHRDNLNAMNVWDFNYGMTALLRLPWKLEVSTDLMMYSRRGYDLNSMNTDDLVWNARLSRTFCKGHLTCYIDGFDILGNLSSIQRTINAQGRTETRYNVMPRYVMAHMIYRFSQPQRKN